MLTEASQYVFMYRNRYFHKIIFLVEGKNKQQTTKRKDEGIRELYPTSNIAQTKNIFAIDLICQP